MTPQDGVLTTVTEADLDACASEPIRVPGSIQPHGALLVLEPSSFQVLQASANAGALLGATVGPGFTLTELEGGGGLRRELEAWLSSDLPAYLRTLPLGGRIWQVLAHRTRQGLILDVEPPPDPEAETLEVLYPHLRQFMERVGGEQDLSALCRAVAAQARAMTGYDRALVYRFDADWNGVVIAEDSNGVLPTCLDLRFPASDIPAQARELYLLNRVRLIASAEYTPVPVLPAASPVDGKALDLSFSALRSVSPIHLEYMRNMGTWASMSVSIVVEGRLWGLISCHKAEPRAVSAHIRAACDFLGQMLALQIGSLQRLTYAAERLALKAVEAELVARLAAEPSYEYGLQNNAEAWMQLTGATGAAVVTRDALLTVGAAPRREAIQQLLDLIRGQGQDEVFVVQCLKTDLPLAPEGLEDVCAGFIAAPISQIHHSYVLWFRPEAVRTVTWGGDPRKPNDPDARLHPRKSFASWAEQVRGCAVPWTEAQVDSARSFRNALLNFVLQRAEERAELTEELSRANKELEAFSYSVSHDLRAPFRHIVGYAELLQDKTQNLDATARRYIDTIIDSALAAGRLVDDLLSFSQTGRASLHPTRVDMDKLVQEVLRVMEPETRSRTIEWRVAPLPPAWGDPAMIRQALQNLVGNAIKYSRDRDPAVIEVSAEHEGGQMAYVVADNGVGFDMTYANKLFGVFQRLHRVEEFEGTGIGLALVRRIAERHGGRVEAFGKVGVGARFRLILPTKPRKDSLG